ncbi:COP9 signalosome complex subunit [Histoplasma capsulatum var. duboisii H88]|uniref:COP9 signalosome complex subunit 6 n=1 Tax=Ajellomyces capsulatus (strain H88) TaxID=544711 RepID=F0UEV9_AJEC8|nr:COP9 signalosome complex subunit [Histoplasma capsulatum var. duboisii H88]
MAELNPLISLRSSDSGLQILLHPLVLLNISDHVTRHFARQEKGPIVGALIGQQKGRTISLEHVFECNVVTSSNGDSVLSEPWDVHKDPPLDLVGWFTLTPPTGPTASQLPIHEHILQKFNETAVLLAFDPSGLENNTSHTTGKLPLTIYESTYEEDSNAVDGDKSMQVDGQQPSLTLRFRELPYYIETGEAEMISIDFVARGGGNATAIEANGATPHPLAVGTKKPVGDKGRDASKKLGKTPTTEEVSALSKEDEDLIANLTTRLTAVKTLESRLHLIKVYLSSISTQQTPNSQTPSTPTSFPQISHSILRNIRSLISHLSLLTPQQSDTFSTESLAQANDVAMVALLGQLGQSVQEIRELGKKFTVVDRARQHAESAMVMSGTHSRMDGFLRQPI